MQRIALLEENWRGSNMQLDAYRERSQKALCFAAELMQPMLAGASRTFPGQSVSAMVGEMNASFRCLIPAGQLVTLALIGIDRQIKELKVWNGGNPSLLLSDTDGKVVRRFVFLHVAIGICNADEFDGTAETFLCAGACTLTLYSDGLLKVANIAGASLGEVRNILALQEKESHDALKNSLFQHLAGREVLDDISLATIRLS